jgi:5-methylcytosine-specific restriction protein B
MPVGSSKLRSRLRADGILVVDGSRLRMTRDTTFSSPSQAAEVLLGRSANGWLDWKSVDGTPMGAGRNQPQAPELALRRRWYEAHASRWEADPGEVTDRRAANDGFVASADEALEILQRLQGDGDVGAFTSALQLWARKPETLAFDGASGQMFVHQLAKTSDAHPEFAQLLAASLVAPSGLPEAREKLQGFVDYVESVKSGHHPAPGRSPFLLSYFWALQDHGTWPVLWRSVGEFLAYLIGEPLPTVPIERYLVAIERIREVDDDFIRFENTASWWGQRRPVFLDESLADRCSFGIEVDSVAPDELEQNAAALVSVGSYIAAEIAEAVSEAAGRDLAPSRLSRHWSEDRPRSDLWANWAVKGHGGLGVRLWLNASGVAIGLRPGWFKGEVWEQIVGTFEAAGLPGYRLIGARGSKRGDDLGFVGGMPGELIYARWFTRSELADLDVRAAVVEAAAATRPLLDNLVQLDTENADEPERSDGWSEYLKWAERFHAHPDFDEWERNYKVDAGERLAALRRDLGRNSADLLDRVTGELDSPAQNLVSWRLKADWTSWVESDPDAALSAVEGLWTSPDAEAGMREFDLLARVTGVATLGKRLNLGSFLLMALGWAEHPPMKVTPFRQSWRLIGWQPEPATSSSADLYGFISQFLDELIEASASWSYPLRDRLDAQSVVWTVTRYAGEPPSGWSNEEWSDFCAFVGLDANRDEPDEPEDVESALDPLTVAASELYLDRAFLADIAATLEINNPKSRKQVVFYGPPGTGKTFVAKRLAAALAPGEGERAVVQFHPSTSYEDFFEGYRPKVADGQMTYELVDGPLRLLADAARKAPQRCHVLVIDELNRANVAKVLGELLYLLEYRNEAVRTLYRPNEEFTLPPNLCFIATMNTADRSIALVDAAMRRRFDFIPFFPDRPPIEGLLERWLEEHQGVRWVGGLVAGVNEELRKRLGPTAQLGPSYFMQPDLTQASLAKIWKANIEPLIEDQFYGHDEEIEQFRFAEVVSRYRGAAGANTLDEAEEAEAAALEAGAHQSEPLGSAVPTGGPDGEAGHAAEPGMADAGD